jgi:multimeric flavodoxin WrbA
MPSWEEPSDEGIGHIGFAPAPGEHPFAAHRSAQGVGGAGNPFARKVSTPIVAARRAGVNFTYAQLQFWFCIMGMVTPGSSYWPIAYGLKPGDAANDAEGLKTITDLADNMAWLLKKLA